MEQDFLKILFYHYKKYPHMRIADFVKLIYQNEFGSAHYIDANTAYQRLLDEMSSTILDANCEMFEELGNGWCRVNLHNPNVDIKHLNEAFVNSSRTANGTLEGLTKKLDYFQKACFDGIFSFDAVEVDNFLVEYQNAGYPAISHSDIYQEEYSPHYRVISNDYCEYVKQGSVLEKRKMEKLGVMTSLLGFGCMRFPINYNGKINEEEAEKMIDYAISKGVNYIDTAYPYHGGESEPFVGKVLDKYERNSYYLATKLPVWQVESLQDAERIFEEQLKRLHKDHVDFYLLHALSKERFDKIKELGVIEFCEQLRSAGKIRYLGFSFHDKYEAFEEIITAYSWDFCQIQYNYMDTLEQAGDKGYELAKKLNIPLVIMEPIKGGSLVTLPDDISDTFKMVRPDDTLACWALRWVATHDNVKVILSGMSNIKQVIDNIASLSDFSPLTAAEEVAVEKVVSNLRKRVKNGCTGCRYCVPCPMGVNIPYVFRLWNVSSKYQNPNAVRYGWNELVETKADPSVCVSCGKCEELCPQKITIRDDLAQAALDITNILKK